MWVTSWERVPAPGVEMADGFTSFPNRHKVSPASYVWSSLPRAVCVGAVAASLRLVVALLLSFLKLMQNALGAVLSLMWALHDNSRRRCFAICRRDKITTQRSNRASTSCQSQTWRRLSEHPWVVCWCQRYCVTAGDALGFSQWNLSSTWDFRLESDNPALPGDPCFHGRHPASPQRAQSPKDDLLIAVTELCMWIYTCRCFFFPEDIYASSLKDLYFSSERLHFAWIDECKCLYAFKTFIWRHKQTETGTVSDLLHKVGS